MVENGLFMNVSSCTSHKKLRFYKIMGTFTYEPILNKKNCIYADIMNTKIFNLIEKVKLGQKSN